MIRRASLLAVALSLPFVAGCAELPDIADRQCGNYVIDEGEDCDTYAAYPGTSCNMSAPSACRYECAPREDGSRPDCAPGMECGGDGLCRAPSGTLDRLGSVAAPGLRELVVADLGGSPGAELISILERRLEINYLSFATDVDVLARVTEPAVATAGTFPLATDLSDDGVADLVTPYTGGFLANLGGPDLKTTPRAHPGLSLADVDAVINTQLEVLPDNPGDEGIVFVAVGDNGALVHVEEGAVLLLAAITGSPADLAGEIVVGQVAEDPVTSPCEEEMLAFIGGSDVLTLVPCRPTGVGGEMEWNDGTVPTSTALPPGALAARGPLLGDLNADGHLDLLIEAAGCAGCPRLFASFGLGDGTFHSQVAEVGSVSDADDLFAPYDGLTVESSDGQATPLRSLPLAMADLDGDGVQDFVTDQAVWISRGSSTTYQRVVVVYDETWSQARIADFNANGLLDIITVVAGTTGMRFYNGAPGGLLNPLYLPTSEPIGHTAVGDFDGDLVLDLATSEPLPSNTAEKRDRVSVLFGRMAGAPEPPVVMGQLDQVTQLLSGRPEEDEILDGTDDITAVSQLPDGSFAFSGFEGRVDRLIRSPFVLTTYVELHFVAYPPRRLAAGRFDDDEHTDLAVLGYPLRQEDEPDYLWLVPAHDEARFEQADAQKGEALGKEVDWNGAALLAVDVDQDGRDELLLAGPSSAGGTDVRLFHAPTAGEGFQLAWQQVMPWSFAHLEDFGAPAEHNGRLLAVDVDGERRREVVALGFSDGVGVLHHFVGMSLSSPGEVEDVEGIDGGLVDVAVVEVDGDGGQELALLTEQGVRWLGAGQPGLEGVSSIVWEGVAQRIAVGDVDDDGLEDVVVADGSVATILKARPVNP